MACLLVGSEVYAYAEWRGLWRNEIHCQLLSEISALVTFEVAMYIRAFALLLMGFLGFTYVILFFA